MTTPAASPTSAVAKLSARSLVLDGEVAIFDQQLRSRFDWLREPDPGAVATPPIFLVFDLLHRDGRDRIGRPPRERRARLEDIVTDNDLVLPVRRLARNGFEPWSEVVAHDYEGYVAKDEASLYETGPTRRWLKVKKKDWTDQEDRWRRRISVKLPSCDAPCRPPRLHRWPPPHGPLTADATMPAWKCLARTVTLSMPAILPRQTIRKILAPYEELKCGRERLP